MEAWEILTSMKPAEEKMASKKLEEGGGQSQLVLELHPPFEMQSRVVCEQIGQLVLSMGGGNQPEHSLLHRRVFDDNWGSFHFLALL